MEFGVGDGVGGWLRTNGAVGDLKSRTCELVGGRRRFEFLVIVGLLGGDQYVRLK